MKAVSPDDDEATYSHAYHVSPEAQDACRVCNPDPLAIPPGRHVLEDGTVFISRDGQPPLSQFVWLPDVDRMFLEWCEEHAARADEVVANVLRSPAAQADFLGTVGQWARRPKEDTP